MKRLITNDDFVDGFLTATTVITILLLLLFSIPVSAQLPESGSLSIKSAAGVGRSISQQVDGNETGNKSLTTLSTTAGFSAPHSMLEFRGWPTAVTPGPAPNCSATSSGGDIVINWDAPVTGGTPTSTEVQVTDNTSSYSSYCCNISVPYPTRTANASTMTTLVSGRTYQFRLFYQNSAGQSSSCFTNQVAFTPPAPPTAPSSVSVSLNLSGDIPISWSGATGDITTYRLERKVNAGSFTFLTNDAASPYTDETPSANNTYTYRVRAEGPGGASGYTESSSISTHEPDAPGNVTAVNDPSVISLSWTRPITGGTITRWSISRSENGGPFLVIATDYPSQTYLDASVFIGRQYQYRVRGVNYFHADAPYGTSNLITRATP